MTHPHVRRLAPLVLLLPLLLAFTSRTATAAAADQLQVGVGRADITSPTGFYMQGWVRSDAILSGVNTRIEARAIVLKRGGQKIALVDEDLNGIAGGAMHQVALDLKSRGFSDSNIIVSASHTHAAPSGYFNYGTYNTVFMTASSVKALTTQNIQGKMDPTLYAFEVRQLELAISKADDDLGPGTVGWGTTQLLHLTANRSLEAHLADFGIHEAKGKGKVSQDPGGYIDTIDPDVQVMRVDKTGVGPVGIWSTFADHGTVNKYMFDYYNDDHHATADRMVEARIRALGHTPAGQDVVNAYGNTDEGDQSAGLTRSGPAAAMYVGLVESNAMMSAWELAGRHMTSTPQLETKWTRVCFCGQDTAGGPISKTATPGLPLFTGSEEGRGPIYDLTGQNFEGDHNAVNDPTDPAQGDKIVVPTGYVTPGSAPSSVPLTVARIDNHLIATIPGEMTVEMGRVVRGAIGLMAKGHGIDGVQLSGLANEYLSYFTSPEEYDAQHYEGGSTMYGRESSVFLMEQLELLTKALVNNTAAPAPVSTDPRNGITDSRAVFGTGASKATAMTQPRTTQRFERATFTWQGGALGHDMRLGKSFVSVQRVGGGVADTDLGLDFLWKVDKNGVYTAEWEIPRSQALGSYRFVINANHYTLTSKPFTVTPSSALSVFHNAVRYPDPIVNTDLTYRPTVANGGVIKAVGTQVAAGRAYDAYGNCNGAAATTNGARAGADTAVNSTRVCAAAVAAARVVPRGTPGTPVTAVPTLPRTGGTPWLALIGVLLLVGTGFGAFARARRP